MASFSDKIHNGPTILTTLKMVKTEVGQLSSTETTAEKDRNDRSVALAFDGFGIGRLPQPACVLCRQPISQPDTELLEALHTADAGGQLGTE